MKKSSEVNINRMGRGICNPLMGVCSYAAFDLLEITQRTSALILGKGHHSA
jgi:hypothetical protein